MRDIKKAFCKIAALALSLALPLSFNVSATQKGDVNGDGTVNSRDAQAVFDYAAGKGTVLSDLQKSTGDVDGDGVLTVGDATQILRYATGTEARLPANAVARLSILSPPYKLNYRTGDSLNMEGFMLSVTYTGGQRRLVNSYSYTGFTGSAGVNIVTVACRGRLVSFTVSVEDPPIKEIQLASLPVKRSYKVGESLSLAGLRLNAVYSDGTARAISGFSASGYSGEAGVHRVKLMYMGKTAEFTVGCGSEATVSCGGSRLNIRTGPGTGYGITGTFREGASIIITDIKGSNGWVQCWGVAEDGSYVHGWCMANYLTLK